MKKFQIKADPCTLSLYLSWVKHVGAQIIIIPTHLVTDPQAPLIRHPFRFLPRGVFVSCIRLPANPILEHCQTFFCLYLKTLSRGTVTLTFWFLAQGPARSCRQKLGAENLPIAAGLQSISWFRRNIFLTWQRKHRLLMLPLVRKQPTEKLL